MIMDCGGKMNIVNRSWPRHFLPAWRCRGASCPWPDGPDPGLGQCEAGALRIAGMGADLVIVVFQPAGCLVGNRGRGAGSPRIDHIQPRFEMKLGSVGSTADAECLVVDRAGCQMHGALRERETVIVPLEDAKAIAGRGENRIFLPGRQQRHGAPAEFAMAADAVFAAIGTGQKLAAEADAQHGFVGIAKGPHQPSERQEMGIVRIRNRRLFAAHHRERIVIVMGLRQGIPQIWAADIEAGAGFGEGPTEEAKIRSLVVLNDQNVHARQGLPLLSTELSMPNRCHQAPPARQIWRRSRASIP